MKSILKKSIHFSALLLLVVAIISCEKDFTDINSGVVSNTVFSTKDTVLDVIVTNAPLENIRTDGLSLLTTPFFGFQGQYLLGAYVNENYESFEASLVTQVNIDTRLTKTTFDNVSNLRVQTTIDTVFIRLPYHATLQSNTDTPVFELDSVVGNQSFDINVFELTTFLNTLNPADPSKTNRFFSDTEYQINPENLTAENFKEFKPTAKDTLIIVKRRNSLGVVYDIDSVRYPITANSNIGLPMAIIPLKNSFAEEVFLNNYQTPNFASQAAFNDYFRGIVIEAKERDQPTGERGGSLISFNLRSSVAAAANPQIEVFYSNTYFTPNNEIDTIIKQNHSFQLGGVPGSVSNNRYAMQNRVYPDNNEVILQGAAGSEASVQILNNEQINLLKSKNWLVNDAALTFYINQESDVTNAPFRLYLYKNGVNNAGQNIQSQIKDVISEGPFIFGGGVQLDNENRKDSYTFKITDYLSDFLSGEEVYNPSLRLKVFNTSDVPLSPGDTLFTRYNWNPKAVSILNGDNALNGARRAQLKIFYTEKEN
ncbi:DUF4270 family protein [uncultured Polaribacter sp.]|uniref:DUF4270 family protein n=1 Tax=uncultured Polaribacter sp. TaxID=174711 RepID=UPI00262B009B|nr:DUF4270 family protein [uncultured Polaribacter sp.]